MTDAQPELGLDDAMAQIQGWLDGKLILSRGAVCTVMAEMQNVRAHPLFLMPKFSEEELQQWEQTLERALQDGKNEPLRWHLPSSPPVPWAADEFLISATGVWELERFWVKARHKVCDRVVFGADGGDPDELDAAKLLSLMIRHRCEVEQ